MEYLGSSMSQIMHSNKFMATEGLQTHANCCGIPKEHSCLYKNLTPTYTLEFVAAAL
jgi:hypothetical protein